MYLELHSLIVWTVLLSSDYSSWVLIIMCFSFCDDGYSRNGGKSETGSSLGRTRLKTDKASRSGAGSGFPAIRKTGRPTRGGDGQNRQESSTTPPMWRDLPKEVPSFTSPDAVHASLQRDRQGENPRGT